MASMTVDLRSDSVTKPNEAMRKAMECAKVDDDNLGEDPTAVELQKEMAKKLGKDAALFTASGTLGNLISILVHCDHRLSEIIVGDKSHIHIDENGNISTMGHVHGRTVKTNEDGTLDLNLIEAAIRAPGTQLFEPVTKLICLETSHTICDGRCLQEDYINKVGELAKKHGLKLHIDGARLFNASAALGVPVKRLVKAADSVMICLAKGLGAPVGAIIAGSKSFIEEARILRKALGGGMAQVGVLCAPALVGVEENIGKLANDHERAKKLAEGLNKIEGLRVDVAAVETNIVYVNIEGEKITAEKLSERLKNDGVRLLINAPYRVRVVTHYQISDEAVEYSISCFKKAMSGGQIPTGN